MYTWNKDTILPFESIWSLVERFKYLNCINGNNFDELLTKLSPNDYVNEFSYLNLNSKKVAILNDLLDLSVEMYYKINIRFILKNIYYVYKPIEMTELTELRYCRECIKTGYHSFYQQFTFYTNCFIHKAPLVINCSACKTTIPYKINNTSSLAYSCQCGNNYFDIKNASIKVFRNKTFISSYTNEIHKLTLTPRKIVVIKGNPILQSNHTLNSFILRHTIKNTYLEKSKLTYPSTKEITEIYNSSRSIYAAISKNKRKKLSKKDMVIIKQITKIDNTNINELSFEARCYLEWKRINEGLNIYSFIDNGRRIRREGTTTLIFATRIYDNYLNDVFSSLIKLDLDYNLRKNIIIRLYASILSVIYKEIQYLIDKNPNLSTICYELDNFDNIIPNLWIEKMSPETFKYCFDTREL